jgi:hypothetical protein
MSALGHERTFAVQNGMSALPQKADMKGVSPNETTTSETRISGPLKDLCDSRQTVAPKSAIATGPRGATMSPSIRRSIAVDFNGLNRTHQESEFGIIYGPDALSEPAILRLIDQFRRRGHSRAFAAIRQRLFRIFSVQTKLVATELS